MNYQKNEIILQAENIQLTYDKPILRDVNFSVRNIVTSTHLQGQVVSLIGRSGIGKTQLFKIIAGLIPPSKGNIKIDIDLHPVKSGEVGVVPQNYILLAHRTVYQNLEIGLNGSGKKQTDREKEEIIKEYANNFHLSEHLKKYPAQLSGGQRQRVSILQQVLTGHKFILFDEPFSGLDVLMIDKVIDLLLKVSRLHDHNTLIIVSHDIENTLAISDTAFILANEKGREQDGATITETLDLLELGLAWNPEIRKNIQFQQLVDSIKHKL